MVSGGLPDNFRNSGLSGSSLDLIAEVQEATKGCSAAPGNTNRSDPAWLVMPGLVPGIHVRSVRIARKTWMAGTRPAITANLP
jgi:hypothetical protein